jgi:uncharacterized protein YqeY
MTIQERLVQDMKAALKSNKKVELETIRMVRSQIKNTSIEKGEDLSEQVVMAVLAKEVKRRKESIKMYEEGNRQDLVKRETQELEIINAYLPEAISEKELENIVDQAIKETDAAGMKDMGKVMGVVMPQVQGRADGRQVQELVKKKLS